MDPECCSSIEVIERMILEKVELDSLEKVGLVRSTQKQIELKLMFGNKTNLVDGFEYELTDF